MRVGAFALAALFGTVAPGVNPAVATAAPAHQQAPGDSKRPGWAPPPPQPDLVPSDYAAKPPPQGYKQADNAQGCPQPAKAGANAQMIKEGPPAQQFLRIPDAQDYVRRHSPYNEVGVNDQPGNFGAAGQRIRVAVIDTGVSPHAFLKDHLEGGGDFIQSGNAGSQGKLDCDFHGTIVAGIIAAKPNDPNIGFTGVAPDAEIVSIRQSSSKFKKKSAAEIKKEQQAQAERAKKAAEARAQKAKEAADAAKSKQQQDQINQLKKQVDAEKKKNKSAKKGGGKSTGGAPPVRQAGTAKGGGCAELPSAVSTDSAGDECTLAQAVVLAVHKHVSVINMSIDACHPPEPPSRDELMLQAAFKYAVDHNVVPVVSAGNIDKCNNQQNGVPPKSSQPVVNPDDPDQVQPQSCLNANNAAAPAAPPASDGSDSGDSGNNAPLYCPPAADNPSEIVVPPWFSYDGNMLAVAATDATTGGVADFSMHGPWISVAAPGNGILSTDAGTDPKTKQGGSLLVSTEPGQGQGSKPVPLQGTSFAAPYVSGLAVLLEQEYPKWTAKQIIQRIEDTAQHPGGENGVDQFVGHGVIDPMAALTAPAEDDFDLNKSATKTPKSSMAYLEPDNTPLKVALLGTAGGIAGLAITLFTMHAIRRSRRSN